MKFRSLGLTTSQLIKEADSGNHGAQAELSLEYLIGEKVERNLREAIEYMSLAAEDIYAINMCFKSAREMDITDAYFAIALQFEYGYGAPTSFEICAKNLLIAAERGYPDAQHMLGYKYRHGFGVPEDALQCEYWHLKALASGIEDAHFDLFLLYYREEELLDMEKAWMHLQKAVEADAHPNAYFNMGDAYLEGKFISPDPVKAAQWFLIAEAKYENGGNSLKTLKKTLKKEEWVKAESMAEQWLKEHEVKK
jgi:TPR repeat protein